MKKMANEKRLIDANALADKVDESKYDNPHPQGVVRVNHRNEHDHFLRMIYDAPTVDAVVLPCDVGDYVYYIDGGYYKEPKFCKVSRPCKIVEVSFKLKGDSGQVMRGFITDNGTRYSFNGIGKTVFLSREEAESALAKRKAKE